MKIHKIIRLTVPKIQNGTEKPEKPEYLCMFETTMCKHINKALEKKKKCGLNI